MEQLAIDFTTQSPLNTQRLGGQNLRLYEYLKTGGTIHVFHPAKRDLRIGYLNSRISDIIKSGVVVYKRIIKVPDINGEPTDVKEYSLTPFI